MKKAYFITGTDTDAGKTYTTVKLLKHFNQQGLKTAALKPIASGSLQTKKGLRNGDALELQAAMSMEFPYEHINPIAFEPPIAPHIAAEKIGSTITVERILAGCQPVLNSNYDVLLVEGAGGWHVPLNDHESLFDLVIALGFPVILVVGMKLGCINHASLTWEHIQQKKIPFAGWVANRLNPDMLYQEENIMTLEKHFQMPPLLTLRYQEALDTLEPSLM